MKILTEEKKYNQFIKRIETVATKYLNLPKKCFIELDFVSAEEIKEINCQTRDIDKVTDVLSFPNLELEIGQKIKVKDFPLDVDRELKMLNLGSIVMCIDKILEQAREYETGENREFCYLLCHGILHVLGFDHIDDDDKKIMRKEEEELLRRINV